jgi:hypothetical protein
MLNIVKFLYFIDFDKRKYIFPYHLYCLINCCMSCLEKILTKVSFEKNSDKSQFWKRNNVKIFCNECGVAKKCSVWLWRHRLIELHVDTIRQAKKICSVFHLLKSLYTQFYPQPWIKYFMKGKTSTNIYFSNMFTFSAFVARLIS